MLKYTEKISYWQLATEEADHTTNMDAKVPVHIQLVADHLCNSLSISSRTRQSAVDFVMEGGEFVHHPIHHRLPNANIDGASKTTEGKVTEMDKQKQRWRERDIPGRNAGI